MGADGGGFPVKEDRHNRCGCQGVEETMVGFAAIGGKANVIGENGGGGDVVF